MTVARYALDGLAETIGALADAIGGPEAAAVRADASSLVETPAALGRRIAAAIAATDSMQRLDALARCGPALDPVPETTSHRRVQARSQAALVTLVRELATIEVTTRSATAPYADRAALLDARDRAIELIDDAATAATDPVYAALEELRAALVEHLAGLAPALARIVTTEELAGLPSLVASYRLYGDVAGADDIAARNHLVRPGFIPGGPVEVAIRD